MTSPSEAYLGCLLCANVKTNEFYCQIVGPGELFERKILGSAFGPGREGALANAKAIAGVDVVHEQPDYRLGSTWYERAKGLVDATTSIGLMKALKNLEDECEKLAGILNPPVQLDFDL